MRHLLFLLTALVLLSCSRSDKQNNAAIFSPSILPVQPFIVNNDRDTILKTLHGSVIRISAGSFDSKGKVNLEIKEAISPAEILAAGMTTESNGQPLGSGGMIYINTIEKNIALLRPISISIPTKSIEPTMQVFKGTETDSGRINWTDPQPLDSTPLQNSIANGKAIFRTKCIACHSVYRKKTGPALAGLENRGPWKDRQQLRRWINNPPRFMATDRYTQALKNEYGSMMTGFADLTQNDINAIADYIKSEAIRPGAFEEELMYRSSLSKIDTSSVSGSGEGRIQSDRLASSLYPDSNNCNQSTVYLPIPAREPVFLDTDTGAPATKDPGSAEAENNDENNPDTGSSNYTFTIDTLGWHNVDFFIDGFPGTWITQVEVTISNQDQTGPVILKLFSPRNKMLTEAFNDKKNHYVFNKTDNGVPLFLQDRAILLAYTSKGNKIYYALKEFTVKKAQSFELMLKESTESDLLKVMKGKKIDNAGLDLTIQEKRVIYNSCGEPSPTTIL